MFLAIHDPLTELFLGKGNSLDFIWQILIRICLAIFLSTILGIERANKRHAAGLRTFVIVTLSATVASIIDVYLMTNVGVIFPAISTSMAIGIAIISSYTILYSSKSQIKGLTTAVALWGQAFIGFSIGIGLYTLAMVAFFLFIILINLAVRTEIYLKNRSNHFEIHLELKNKTDLPTFIAVVRDLGLQIDDIESNPAYANTGLSVYTISLSIYNKELKKYKTHTEIINSLKTLPYISHIEELH